MSNSISVMAWTYSDNGRQRFVVLPEDAERLAEEGHKLIPLYTLDNARSVRDLYHRLAVLVAAAGRAAGVFQHYADLHAAKGTQEGLEKASRNLEEAKKLQAAMEAATCP